MNTPIKDLFALAEEAIAPVIWTEKKALNKFKESATPERVREVAEAFRALEQRAEAAEHERDCHMDIAEHFKALCKELQQQKPYGYVHNLVDPPGGGVAASIFKEESRHYGRPVFTRPAPAINLAELVPDEDEVERIYSIYCTPTLGSKNALRHIRKEILRNIEERTNGENTTTEKVDSLE